MIDSVMALAKSRSAQQTVGAILCLTIAAGCGLIRHRTPARCEPGLPCYDGYGQKSTLGRVPGLTFTGIRLTEQPAPEDVLARTGAPAVAGHEQGAEQKKELTTRVREAVQNAFVGTEPTPVPAAPSPDPISTPAPAAGAAVQVAITDANPTPSPAATQPIRVRYFALANDKLQVDQCRLTQVSLILWSDGRWELFVRAEQNPEEIPEGTPAGTAVAARPQRNQTSHIKRNVFHIVAKGFGTALPADAANGDRLAKPVLLHRSMNPFWVERGQPKELTFTGRLDAIQDFDLIKRFEVEFAYR